MVSVCLFFRFPLNEKSTTISHEIAKNRAHMIIHTHTHTCFITLKNAHTRTDHHTGKWIAPQSLSRKRLSKNVASQFCCSNLLTIFSVCSSVHWQVVFFSSCLGKTQKKRSDKYCTDPCACVRLCVHFVVL